jgi:hypothetical protein
MVFHCSRCARLRLRRQGGFPDRRPHNVSATAWTGQHRAVSPPRERTLHENLQVPAAAGPPLALPREGLLAAAKDVGRFGRAIRPASGSGHLNILVKLVPSGHHDWPVMSASVYLSELQRCRHLDLVLLVPATGLTGCGKRQMRASEGRGPSDRGVTNNQSVIIRELCKSPG